MPVKHFEAFCQPFQPIVWKNVGFDISANLWIIVLINHISLLTVCLKYLKETNFIIVQKFMTFFFVHTVAIQVMMCAHSTPMCVEKVDKIPNSQLKTCISIQDRVNMNDDVTFLNFNNYSRSWWNQNCCIFNSCILILIIFYTLGRILITFKT